MKVFLITPTPLLGTALFAITIFLAPSLLSFIFDVESENVTFKNGDRLFESNFSPGCQMI